MKADYFIEVTNEGLSEPVSPILWYCAYLLLAPLQLFPWHKPHRYVYIDRTKITVGGDKETGFIYRGLHVIRLRSKEEIDFLNKGYK